MTASAPAAAERPPEPSPATVSAQAFEDVLSRYRSGLARVAATYARTPADRQDLAQEIALGVWRALPSFRGDCSERTFVYRIAHNLGVSRALRSRGRNVTHDADALAAVADEAPGPEARYVRATERRDLWDAIRALPLPSRSVLTLALEDLPHAEIAAVLGITSNLVAVRLSRAKDELRRALGDRS